MFGGISLAWKKDAILNDRPPVVYNSVRSEIVQRLLAQKCENCGSEDGPFEVHHVRRLVIWIDRDKRSDRYGSSEWPHAAARLWSSVTGATRTSIGIAPGGTREQGTGKPDEIEILTSGLERGCWKSTELVTRRHPTLPHVRFDERGEETDR